ncbi:hypothetical protein GGI20_004890 [Coemansia sp. BCRC 34301]|nr:hypothetical protein GGI20_004890 [Coemansia sp. BCRC 34301]
MRCALLVSLAANTRQCRRLFSTARSFGDLGVDAKLVAALGKELQIHMPTSMQGDLLQHTVHSPTANLLVRQPTGSGKTLALAVSLLTLALRDHQALGDLGLSPSEAFAVQAANSVVVVPNRELAFQIESWITRLLDSAYPEANRHRFVGRFVSGSPYETQQRGVLKRHGVPAIIVGTPRSLLELAFPASGESLIDIRAPSLLQALANGEEVEALMAQKDFDKIESFRGVRRLVLDEVDAMLRLPNRHATERQKKLRREKPKPGQVFVDRLMDTLGITQIAKRLRPPAAPAPVVRKSSARGWHKHSDIELARKGSSPPPPLARRRIEPQFNVVGPRSLQIIALSATANKDLRNWMVHRGWMLGRPLAIDNASASIEVPSETTHHCLVIENDRAIRNLREKVPAASPEETPLSSSRSQSQALEEDEELSKDGARDAEHKNLEHSMMEQMSEVAANVIRAIDPQGSVIIFTRSDASTAQFGRVLESYGVSARDIMTRFDSDLAQQIDKVEGKEFADSQKKYASLDLSSSKATVFLATEEAARGLDLPDASLVLILDIPKSVASYAHLSGRTGRFGQSGTVVSVVPVGRLGWYESKMRGIFASLGIRPTKANFIQD